MDMSFADYDPDWFEVVFLKRCPYCGDKLKSIWHPHYTMYKHYQYRGWCYHTNMYFGTFTVNRRNPTFLNPGHDGGVYYD